MFCVLHFNKLKINYAALQCLGFSIPFVSSSVHPAALSLASPGTSTFVLIIQHCMPDTCSEFIPQNVFSLEAGHFMQKNTLQFLWKY